MNEFIFNQRIENARQLYSVKFLNEQFEDKFENKMRKDKLNKLLENTTDVKKQIKNREQEI